MAFHDEPRTARTMVARYEALIRVSEALRAYHDRAALDSADLGFIEKGMIERAVSDAKHNKPLAARTLGLTRKQLYVRLRQHGLA